jgi:Domain of unknown function (DUF4145)
MLTTQCQVCRSRERLAKRSKSIQPLISINAFRGAARSRDFNFSIECIITCHVDGHKRPMRIRDGVIDATSPTLPISESTNLSPRVPSGIKQDVEEAERDHLSRSYKSAVVMCRRALQLGLELMPNAPQNQTLGRLLGWAKNQNHPKTIPTQPLLSERVTSLAEGIKDYGDGGAHRAETFGSSTVAMVIHVTVEVLNELFP